MFFQHLPSLICVFQHQSSFYRNWADTVKPYTGQLYIENNLAKKQPRGQRRVEETVCHQTFYAVFKPL